MGNGKLYNIHAYICIYNVYITYIQTHTYKYTMFVLIF